MRAAQEGQTLAHLIERVLRDYLQAGPRGPVRPFCAELLTKRGRTVAGVDLDDRDALYERIDAPD